MHLQPLSLTISGEVLKTCDDLDIFGVTFIDYREPSTLCFEEAWYLDEVLAII